MSTLRLAAANNRFHYGETITAKGKREKGEKVTDNGDGTATITYNGRFVALVKS